jgi:hypothetical protein
MFLGKLMMIMIQKNHGKKKRLRSVKIVEVTVGFGNMVRGKDVIRVGELAKNQAKDSGE